MKALYHISAHLGSFVFLSLEHKIPPPPPLIQEEKVNDPPLF